jgi:type VI secretion system secreted protein VgrG
MKKFKVLTISLIVVMLFSMAGLIYTNVSAAGTAPGLGDAAPYSVLGPAGVTNTGSTTLSGLVGADLSIDTGINSAGQNVGIAGGSAEVAASAAYDSLWAQAGGATNAGPDLSSVTLGPGVYTVGNTLLSGVLTLNGPGVYIFLSSSGLTSSGSVSLENGARACDVYWSEVSSATITGGSFVGTIIAHTSISLGTGVTLDGRALALTGSVTLDTNTIGGPSCASAPAATAAPASNNNRPSPTATPVGRRGLPNTGGAPEGILWIFTIIAGFSAVALFFGIRSLRNTNRSK